MSTGFFNDITEIPFEGADSANPLAFRHYNPDEIVMGKRMEDHLRFAACYWHNFCWDGADVFGQGTFAAQLGSIAIVGLAGSVEADATVYVTNQTTSEQSSTPADSDGAFALQIAGQARDLLRIEGSDSA